MINDSCFKNEINTYKVENNWKIRFTHLISKWLKPLLLIVKYVTKKYIFFGVAS